MVFSSQRLSATKRQISSSKDNITIILKKNSQMAISFVFIFFIIISPTYINSIFIKNIHKIIGFPSFIYPINNSHYR